MVFQPETPALFQPDSPQLFQPEEPREPFQPEQSRIPTPGGEASGQERGSVGAAFVEGASEALQLDRVPGITPGSDFERMLQGVGLLRDPNIGEVANALRVLDQPTRMTIAALDTASRIFLAPFEGGIKAAGRLYEAAGGSQGDARRLERDLYGLFEVGGLVGLGSPVGTVSRSTRRQAQREVQHTLDEPMEAIPEGAREQVREAIEGQIEATASIGPDALASARAKIGQPTLGETVDAAIYSRGERARADFLDRLAPIRFAAEQRAKAEGITPDLDPYRDMRLVAGIRGVVESVMRRGTVARTEGGVEFNGKGLTEILGPVAGDIENMQVYFAGRRAAELRQQGRERLFTGDEIDAMLDLGRANPALETAFDEYQAFNRRILDFAEQSGMLSPEAKASFLRMGQSYVPFYRVAIDAQEGGGLSNVRGSIFRRLKGGTSNVNEITENMVRNATMWIDASVKNHALTRAVDTVIDSPMADTLERVTVRPEQVRVVDRQIADALGELGEDVAGQNVSALSFNRPPGENIIQIFREGQREFYRVNDPVMLKALTAFTPKATNLGMRILGGFTNTLRRGVTLSPDFMLRNLVRDTQVAFVQSNTRFIPVVDSVRGMARRIAQDENYWKLLANGGGFATTYAGETRLGSDLSRFYRSQGFGPHQILDTPHKLADFAERSSSAFEMASRLGEFTKLVDQGTDLRDAALAAREISTDFALRGGSEIMDWMTTTVPFFNARLQGLDRLYREARQNPGRFAIKGLTAITLPSLALHAYNRNDPRYAQIEDWVKDQHWVLFIPGRDEPFLIPKGFEVGALFATVPERIFNAIEEQHGKRFADAFGRMIFETLSFNPIPQAASPIVEQVANRDLFTGRPIVPADLENVRPSEQFRPWTSETLIQIAKEMREETGVEMSPARVENLIVGYFGTLGLYALQATDMLTRAVSDTGEAPDKRLDEIPVLRSFYRDSPARRTQYETDFYDLLGAAREVSTTVNHMIRQGRDPGLRDDEERLFGLMSPLQTVQSTAAEINRAIRLIHQDPELSGSVKRERIDRLLQQRNDLFSGVMEGLAASDEGMAVMRDRGLLVPPEAAARSIRTFQP